MKKTIKCIKIFGFIFLILFIGYNIQKVVSPKFNASQGLQSGFMEEKENSIDVLFLGTSNMFHTINPIILYEETGITSFDFGSSSQSLNMTYMYLKEALKTQSPKVVCLEVLASRSDFNSELYEPGLRWGFTYFPDSLNKYSGLYGQLGKVNSEYISYVFPLFRYKDRWKELQKNDFENELATYWKGYRASYKVTEVEYGEGYWGDIDWKLAPRNIEMLDNIRMLCAENDIELLFYKAPTPTLWKSVYSDRIREYADKYSIPFIDYNTKMDLIGIEQKKDFMDAGHVNVYGSVKITRDMGNYLKENYVLEDHRSGENNSWDIAEMERRRYEYNAQMMAAENLDMFLNFAPDDSYTIMCIIEGNVDNVQKDKLRQFQYIFEDDVEICISEGGKKLFEVMSQEEYLWHNSFSNHEYSGEKTQVENNDGNVLENIKIYVDGVDYDVVENSVSFIVVDKQLDKVIGIIGFDAESGYVKTLN